MGPWRGPGGVKREGLTSLRDGRMVEGMERQLIERTLQRFEGNRAKTAKALGMGVRTLGMKLKQWREEAAAASRSESLPMALPAGV